MRKLLTVTAVALALGTLFPQASALSAAHAQAAAPSMVSPNRFGLPDFGDLVEQVGPAVVNIRVVQRAAQGTAGENPLANDPFYDFLRRFGVPMPGFPGQPGMGPRARQGIGSGFIVSKDGYVLTNAHVVAGEDGDAALSEVTVTLIDKREFKAKVVGIDRRTDVALLKLDASGLPAVKIGNPDQARVGEWVVAMGSPFGFDNTVTAGIISAKARRLPDETYVPFIQTDVAINPGNSGGPLFNLAGEVIGINSQIYSRSGGFMGISFAIPIDVAMNIKDQLVSHGRVQRGRLGIAIQNVDKDLAQSFGLTDPRGALVASVEPGSAADKAGLQAGDVVLAVDGRRIDDSAELPRVIGEKRPGTRVKLELARRPQPRGRRHAGRAQGRDRGRQRTGAQPGGAYRRAVRTERACAHRGRDRPPAAARRGGGGGRRRRRGPRRPAARRRHPGDQQPAGRQRRRPARPARARRQALRAADPAWRGTHLRAGTPGVMAAR